MVPDAGGVRRGDPVQMRGVNIGRVVGFGMVPEGVEIRLELYDAALLDKPRLVAANKMDEDAAAANLAKFRKRYARVAVIPISCLSEEGLPALRKELLKLHGPRRPAALEVDLLL